MYIYTHARPRSSRGREAIMKNEMLKGSAFILAVIVIGLVVTFNFMPMKERSRAASVREVPPAVEVEPDPAVLNLCPGRPLRPGVRGRRILLRPLPGPNRLKEEYGALPQTPPGDNIPWTPAKPRRNRGFFFCALSHEIKALKNANLAWPSLVDGETARHGFEQ